MSPQFAESLEPRCLLSAQLARDINPTGSSSPTDLTASNGAIYFAANDGTRGEELWKSDASGTTLVKDILPKGASSTPRDLTDIDGTLYFSTYHPTRGTDLWRTDGTDGSTTLVKDISDKQGANNRRLLDMTPVGDKFFFNDESQAGADGISRLWVSDGTADGTVVLKTLSLVSVSEGLSFTDLTSLNGELYFFVLDEQDFFGSSTELWKTDGTEAGTKLIKGFNGTAFDLVAFNGALFFDATDDTHWEELWTSDGTAKGTVLFKDISPDEGSLPQMLTVAGDTLFFQARGDEHGIELWKSDGTKIGTKLVQDSAPIGADSSFFSLTAVDDRLFYSNDVTYGYELWESDGTSAGTGMIRDINDHKAHSSFPHDLTNVNGRVYFTADDEKHGREVWTSDGSEDGTIRITDIQPGSATSSPGGLAGVGNTVYFSADDAIHGTELWSFTPDFYLHNRVLAINGTDAADTIGLTIRSGRVRIDRNGEIQSYPLAKVSRIEITTRGGNDVIDWSGIAVPTYCDAGAGNDKVTAGSGNDTLTGGAGKDTLVGGDGADRVNGSGSPDKLFGGAGNDRLDGGAGNDILDGGGGADRLTGADGNDLLLGGSSNDKLYGDAGNDTLNGQKQADLIEGGDGEDTAVQDVLDTQSSIETVI